MELLVGLSIRQPQHVVGLIDGMADRCRNGLLVRCGVRLVMDRKVSPNRRRLGSKGGEIVFRMFRPECEGGNPHVSENPHAPPGKHVGRLNACPHRQFDDYVRSVTKRSPGPRPLIQARRFPALQVITTHGNHHHTVGKPPFNLAKLIQVAVMKRVIFRNDSNCFHYASPTVSGLRHAKYHRSAREPAELPATSVTVIAVNPVACRRCWYAANDSVRSWCSSLYRRYP